MMAESKQYFRARSTLRGAEQALTEALRREGEINANIANMAHELRTPLTAILGYTEVMSGAGNVITDLAKQREYAAIVHQSTKQLVAICDRLLGAEALGENNGPTVEEDVDVGVLIGDVARLFGQMARDRGVNLETEVAANFPILHLDRVCMHRVLSNLVSNAIKFTPRGGAVRMKAYIDPDSAVIIMVQDTGCGVSPEDIQRITDPNMQIDGAAQHGDQGWGLGLAITKRVVAEMGATLDIRSEEGVGTIVAVRFPPEAFA